MHRDKPKTRKVELRDKVEESSGNVFADLGFENPEGMLARAELARRICEIIAGRKLTKSQAAKILCADEPEVSAPARDARRILHRPDVRVHQRPWPRRGDRHSSGDAGRRSRHTGHQRVIDAGVQ